MTWVALKPYQTSATLPVYVPGRGPVGKRRRLVYRGRVAERDSDGRWAKQDTWQWCGHDHLKSKTATVCSERYARHLNKEGAR